MRDLTENKQVKPYHIDGKKNPADILTKNLSQVLFLFISWLRNTLSQSTSTFIT